MGKEASAPLPTSTAFGKPVVPLEYKMPHTSLDGTDLTGGAFSPLGMGSNKALTDGLPSTNICGVFEVKNRNRPIDA